MTTASITRGSFSASTPIQKEHDSGFCDGFSVSTPAVSTPLDALKTCLFSPFQEMFSIVKNPSSAAQIFPLEKQHALKVWLQNKTSQKKELTDTLENHYTVKYIQTILNRVGSKYDISFTLDEAKVLYMEMYPRRTALWSSNKSLHQSLNLNESCTPLFVDKSFQEESLSPNSHIKKLNFDVCLKNEKCDIMYRDSQRETTREVCSVKNSSCFKVPDSRLRTLIKDKENSSGVIHALKLEPPSPVKISEPDNRLQRIPFYSSLLPNEKDVISGLSAKNCHATLAQILAYLPDQDVQSMSCVNSTWRRVVLQDSASNQRRVKLLQKFQKIKSEKLKENQQQRRIKASGTGGKILSDVKNKTGYYIELSIVRPTTKSICDSIEEDISICNTFLKCPKCSYPSKLLTGNKFCCTRQLCQHEFCKECQGPYFNDHSCRSTCDKKDIPKIVIGSKKSKRNLKRL